MDYNTYTKDELSHIASEWCEAYESGNPVVSDEEYDELVQYLNTENTAEIGAKSQTENYTVKHAFIMGSLSKVHAIQNDSTGAINFAYAVYDDAPKNVIILKEVNNALSKAHNAKFAEFSPKLDGNSFSLSVQLKDDDTISMTCATRGNGEYGVDILQHFLASKSYNHWFSGLADASKEFLKDSNYDTFVIRGEAIVKNTVYNFKYADKFKNPRVFVSGTLNREFDITDKKHNEHLSACNDIDYICYDYRLINSKTQDYVELSWMNPKEPTYKMLDKYSCKLGQQPDFTKCFITELTNNQLSEFQITKVYRQYEQIRKESDYALDGIVVKPECSARLKNLTNERPDDMIAIKFVPLKMHSTIIDIEWTLTQNGECYPKGIIEPIKYDGKDITRVGLHGYSFLVENKCGIGSDVEMVMNGDIVPGVYKVLSEGSLKMPNFETYINTVGKNKTLHLYKKFSSVAELDKHSFCASVKALGIDGIKLKTAEKIWDSCNELYSTRYSKSLNNLMMLMFIDEEDSIKELLYECMGTGKSVENIITALHTYRQKMTLADAIKGLCIEDCGEVTAEVCADIISGLDYDTTGLNENAYSWAFDTHNAHYKTVEILIEKLGIKKKEKTETLSDADVIKVILTGSPKSAGYSTKSDWLKAHPQYVETTKWNECQVLVTNDIESGTGKMAKATKLGIPIRTYFDE